MNGFLCVNKPRGPSSFKIISQIRRLLNIKKAGHCGTLDPQAEGLLVVALGTSTRLLQYVQFEPKCYQFSIQFGSETDTLDCEGAVVASGGTFPEKQVLEDSLNQFRGSIMQVPPGYSAIKVDGERAYARARKGETVQLEPRPITIFDLSLLKYNNDTCSAELSVSCSSGTYVRSLIRDISHACDTFGTAGYIKRISVGKFSLDQAISIETTSTNVGDHCISPELVFNCDDIIEVDDDTYRKIVYGQSVVISTYHGVASSIFASRNGKLVAVLKNMSPGIYHPDTVLDIGAQ